MEADEVILIDDVYPMIYTSRSDDRGLNEETVRTGGNSRDR